MPETRGARLDMSELLGAVENAAPVDAADVLGRHLAATLGATEVSFLIADFSGKALIRLGHAPAENGGRTHGNETAERLPLGDGPHGRVLVRQRIEVDDLPGGGILVLAPVTNRGETIGVLEARLARRPDDQAVADVALAAHALAYVVIANRRFTDLFEWGQRSVPAPAAPGRLHVRGRAVHDRRLARTRRRQRRGHLRLLARARDAAPLVDRRDGP